MSTRAWVVDRPLSAPNCFWSSLDNTWFTIQVPTYDSSSLDRVGVKEIGRRSVSVFPGGCTFWTGTTLARFHSCGKIPVLTEVLKIQDKGSASHVKKSRRNQLGIPSGPGDLYSLKATQLSVSYMVLRCRNSEEMTRVVLQIFELLRFKDSWSYGFRAKYKRE